MAEINKLSVETALDKLRAGGAKQSRDTLSNNKIDALNEEMQRIRKQRLRLEQHQRKRDKGESRNSHVCPGNSNAPTLRRVCLIPQVPSEPSLGGSDTKSRWTRRA
jgi:hypothetical protein